MTHQPSGFLRALRHHAVPTRAALSASALPWIAAICLASPGIAEEAKPSTSGTDSTLLDEVVVTATRTEECPASITAAYTKFSGDEIKRTQVPLVKQTIALSPGVSEWQYGAEGDLTSVSIRGNRAQDTLLIIDGVKAKSNSYNYPYAFSSASSLNLESVEIVRGPYSTLYGSNAIGGVVALQTRRGSGDPKATTFFEGGSYNTFREGIQSDGSLGALDYSFHYSREDTSNSRPNNDFGNNNGSLRLDWTVSDKLTLGVSTRSVVSDYQAPNNIFINDPNAKSRTELTTVAAYAELKATDIWTSKLTLGSYQERYHTEDPLPTPDPWVVSDGFNITESANWTADWQNILHLTDTNRLLLGTTLLYETGHQEADYGYGNGPQSLHSTATNVGVYAEDQWEVVKNLTLTGGLRYEHFELANNAFTYRGGAAYFIEPTRTKLRASYGTAFRAPSFDESASTALYNGQKLDPERSRSWDIGFDQYLAKDRIALGAAYFNTRTKDAIVYQYTPFYQVYYANLAHQNTHGIETSTTVKFNEHWQARLAYTWTESENDVERSRRIPRHVVSADTNYTFDLPKGKLTLGGGLLFVGQREDTHALTYAKVDMPDYTLLRIYGRYELNERVAFTARVENLTDKQYEPIHGYPALGRAYYGGMEVKF